MSVTATGVQIGRIIGASGDQRTAIVTAEQLQRAGVVTLSNIPVDEISGTIELTLTASGDLIAWTPITGAVTIGLSATGTLTSALTLDPETQALLTQATTDGFTAASGATLTALDTFIKTLKSIGAWDLSDVIWLPATNGDVDFACYNLKNPAAYRLLRVNSPTFTPGQGFTGNGTSAYLDTQWTPSLHAVNYQLNSASFGDYTRSNISNTTTMGVTVGGSMILFQSAFRVAVNNTFVNNGIPTGTITFGFEHADRDDSANIELYLRGVLHRSYANASTSLPTSNLTLLARNNGTIQQFNGGQISFAWAGASMSSIASDFYNAIQTYMTSIGAAV